MEEATALDMLEVHVWDYCIGWRGVERKKNVMIIKVGVHLQMPCMAQEVHKITGYNFVAILPRVSPPHLPPLPSSPLLSPPLPSSPLFSPLLPSSPLPSSFS